MYKSWVLVFSVLVLLPIRWLTDLMPKETHPLLPVLPLVALVTCGELVLNNPTVSPAGPYCPGTSITISFTGTNLPEGDNIQVFWDQSSTFNPFNSQGTQIGSIPIDYTCSTCPTIMAVMFNPATCSSMYPNDEQNEFMVLGSGCGFNVSNFQLNPSVGGAGVNDSIGGSQGCGWSLANATTAVAFLTSNGTNCSGNIFAAGPGTNIPGGAIVIAFSDAFGPNVPFNFQSLCETGMPIYVISSSCDRNTNFGAYSNTLTSSPSYTLSGCSSGNTFTYNSPPPPMNSGVNNVVALGGSSFVQSSSCTDPGLSSLNFADIPIATASLNYTIPAGICGSGSGTMTYYVSGMISQNAPCSNTIYTPPSNLSLSVACPAIITPAGPFCASGSPVQLSASPTGGTWSGGAYISSTGVFNPALANIGNNTVTYTVAPCGSVSATIVVNDAPIISGSVDTTNVACTGLATGQAVFTGSINGGSNVTYDWDNADTPGNEVYPDDNSFGLSNVIAGNYYFIATSDNGCADTLEFSIGVFDPVTYDVQIFPINCFGQTGGINLYNIVSPGIFNL